MYIKQILSVKHRTKEQISMNLFFLSAHIYFNWLGLFFSGLIQFNLETKGFLTTHKVDLQVNIYTLTNYYWINKALCKKL